MARRIPWRRLCPDVVKERIENALQARIYLLRETGPTGFLVKEDGIDKKFKVFLGDVHSCTCPTFMKSKELCIHILWVLLKKFRVPKQNHVVFQLSLVEREINEVIRGAYLHSTQESRTKSDTSSASQDKREKLKQKEVTEEDACPICQEEFLEKPEPLTYCKYGCGNSVHIKCMKVWAEHQRSTGETTVKCPLCRVDFGTFQDLMNEYHNSSRKKTRANRQDLHLGAVCQKCKMCPIVGKCFRCVVCADYHLCQQCFPTDTHMKHNFQFRQKPSQRWRPAVRVSSLPSAVVSNLQNREITDSDYDLLLQLDRQVVAESIPGHVISGFPVEVLREKHKLLVSGNQCGVCLQGYRPFNCVRTLPCRHEFHRDCIDNWLSSHVTCPVDGLSVSTARANNNNNTSHHTATTGGQNKSCRLLQKRHTMPGHSLPSYETDPNLTGLPVDFALSGSGLLAKNTPGDSLLGARKKPSQTLINHPKPTNHASNKVSISSGVQGRLAAQITAGCSASAVRDVPTPPKTSGNASGIQLVFDPSVRGRPPHPAGESGEKRSKRPPHQLGDGGENRNNRPPLPPGESGEKRSNSGDSRKGSGRVVVRKRRPSLTRYQNQRSSSEGDLGLTATGTAVQSITLESPIRKQKGQLMRGKLLPYNSGIAYSNPDLSTEPIMAAGISLCLPGEFR